MKNICDIFCVFKEAYRKTTAFIKIKNNEKILERQTMKIFTKSEDS